LVRGGLASMQQPELNLQQLQAWLNISQIVVSMSIDSQSHFLQINLYSITNTSITQINPD
jgi:hypothetical protein